LIGSEFVEVQDNDTGVLFEGVLVTATKELAAGSESKQTFLCFLVRFELIFLQAFTDVSDRPTVFAGFDICENISQWFVFDDGCEVLEYGEVHGKHGLGFGDYGLVQKSKPPR